MADWAVNRVGSSSLSSIKSFLPSSSDLVLLLEFTSMTSGISCIISTMRVVVSTLSSGDETSVMAIIEGGTATAAAAVVVTTVTAWR